MRANRKTLLLLGLLVATGAVVISAVVPLSYPTNCGGNAAALARVHEYVWLAKTGAMDSPDHTFRIDTLTAEQRKLAADLAHYHWIPEARFLVSITPFSDQGSKSRRVIVVCDRTYRNVPRRWIGSAAPAHAAGFSDGSVSLISPAEFAALDRSSFKFLDELYPTK